jgi:hypothetical protein
LGVKKPALYYFLSDFASSNLTAVGGVFPAREDKIFVDVDLEKRSIWSYVEDGEHSRAKTLFGKRKQSVT